MIHNQANKQPTQRVNHLETIYKKVLVDKDKVPNLTNFSRVKLTKKQSIEQHMHQDMFEIYFILKGKGIMMVEDQPIALSTGDCLVVEPKETHSLLAKTDLEILYFGLVGEKQIYGLISPSPTHPC